MDRPMIDDLVIEDISTAELTNKISKEKTKYKVNENFLLREVADEYLLIPTGESTSSINGMISLNETFYFIWQQFQQPHTIYEVVLSAKEEYDDVDDCIVRDIYRFVLESLKLGFIEKEGRE